MKWSLLLFGLVAIAGTAAACEGLSPGDILQHSRGHCTLGFLVAAPDGLYFTTAGHCVAPDEPVSNPEAGEFGVAAFRYLDPDTGAPTDGSPGHDFALIRVKESAYASLNPKMCGWEGPTGIYTDSPGDGLVRLWGHSLLFGDAGAMGAPTYKREGVLYENDGDAFYFFAPSLMGDSGSAVLHEDGRALGVLTHLQVGVGGSNGGTHLERGFRLAAEAGFTQLRLVLAGEDPVAVLREMRGEVPQAGGEPTTTPPSQTPPSAPPTATPPPSQRPATPTPTQNDSISPAETPVDDPGTDGKETPSFGVASLALAAVAVALARRRRL